MTPSRQQITERAFKRNMERNFHISSISPEIDELRESGDYESARIELMQSQDAEYKAYVEQCARELGLIREEIEIGKQIKPYEFQIDIQEALRSGVFICGGKGTTKTNLAKIIVDRMLKLGYVVKVFDISKAWLKSSIPYYVEVKTGFEIHDDLYQSIVYDLSQLTPKKLKRFIARVLELEWNKQTNISEDQRKWIIYGFEETQMLTPQGSLRSNESQQTLRVMTSGRNYDIGYIAITQRAALCDTSVFELSFQRYFARLDGANDKSKVSEYIGSLAYALEKLKIGEFMYDMGSVTKWITTKEFEPKTKSQRIEIRERPIQPIKPKREHTEIVKALANVFIFVLWLILTLIALSQMMW